MRRSKPIHGFPGKVAVEFSEMRLLLRLLGFLLLTLVFGPFTAWASETPVPCSIVFAKLYGKIGLDDSKLAPERSDIRENKRCF